VEDDETMVAAGPERGRRLGEDEAARRLADRRRDRFARPDQMIIFELGDAGPEQGLETGALGIMGVIVGDMVDAGRGGHRLLHPVRAMF
jgi:hypothetical protein